MIFWLAVSLGLFTLEIGRAVGGVDRASFGERVQALRGRVTELAGDHDLLDTLYFGWSDRPYARATLAILIKVAATLEREVEHHGHGNGKIDDATMESMLQWSDGAIQRAIRAQPTSEFRPLRMKTTWAAMLDGTDIPSLYAFVDGTRLYPCHPLFGDLDVLAALGQRVYSRPLGREYSQSELQVSGRRAEALGLVLLDCTIFAPEGVTLCGSGLAEVQTSWPERRPYVAFSSLAMLALDGEPRTWENPPLPAVRARTGGESFPSSLARRAMLRGAINRSTYAVTRWAPPIIDAPADRRLVALRAGMWVHAFDGQRLALIDTWHDEHGEDNETERSVFLNPAEAETIAHTALDLQRLAKFVSCFGSRSTLAVAVGREATCGEPQEGCPEVGRKERGSDTDIDAWAPWVQPIWDALVTRQVSFDVVSDRTEEKALQGRYQVVFPLRRRDCVDPARAIGKIERRLAQVEEHVYRLTAREMNGTIASDVYVRAGKTSEGKGCAAVVNLSDRVRMLKLRGRPAIGASRDVIADQQIPEPDQRLEIAPWQVRLLWPRE